ncbi:MAG: DUF3459 domain-containing protein [Rhizobacter sp.]|nr:DUF3459 domain-containing protein [Chlorobiales bacterium]
MRLLFVSIITLIAFLGALLFFIRGYAKSPTALSRVAASPSADWVKSAVVYEMFVRDFTPEGTFIAAEKKLPEIKALGATVIWLMPIHPIGKEKRKGEWGSPYAVQDYYAVSPDFGTKDDFKRFVAAAHAQGLKVIIDMVANHTAWDNALIKSHPEWYTKDSTGNIISPNPDWLDVADLNYDSPELRKYMTEMMTLWIKECDIDGYRCDVSELIPIDFWRTLVPELKKVKPSLLMISEGTAPAHHIGAFDLTYAWNTYDAMVDISRGKKPATALDDALELEAKIFPQGALRMRFNTNHDKNAYDGTPVELYGVQGAKATAVLAFTMGGYGSLQNVPMIYNGDEVGGEKRLTLFEKIPVDWQGKHAAEFRDLYRKLIALRKSTPAMTEGEMAKLKTSSDETVFAFMRKTKESQVIVAVNFGTQEFTGFVKTDAGKMLTDYFDPSKQLLTKDGNLKLVLKPLEYRVFSVSAAKK